MRLGVTNFRIGTLVMLAMLAASRGMACGVTPNPIFEDDFSAGSHPLWHMGAQARFGFDSSANAAEQAITPGPQSANETWYDRPVPANVTVCVRMRLSGSAGNGGIMFWRTGENGFTTAKVDGVSGTLWVAQYQGDHWVRLATAQRNFAGVFKTYNEFEVRTNPGGGEIYVAGSRVLSFNAQAPAGGSQVGLIGDNETTTPAAFTAHFQRFGVFRGSEGSSPPLFSGGPSVSPPATPPPAPEPSRQQSTAVSLKVENDYRVPIKSLHFESKSNRDYGPERLENQSMIHAQYMRTFDVAPSECTYDFLAVFDNDHKQEVRQDICRNPLVVFDGAPFGKLLSLGSGFYIDGDGHIMTNNHVVYGCASVAISQGGEGDRTVTLMGQDSARDLALLHEDGIKSVPVPFRPPEYAIQDGEFSAVLGYPLGVPDLTINTGNVSSSSVAGQSWLFKMQTPINHGNSGGPVVDAAGRVIGVVVSSSARPDAQAINFAIRGDVAQRFAASLGVKPVTLQDAQRLDVPDIRNLRGWGVLQLKCFN